jgi:DNA-binding Xre family transcriptional regulator
MIRKSKTTIKFMSLAKSRSTDKIKQVKELARRAVLSSAFLFRIKSRMKNKAISISPIKSPCVAPFAKVAKSTKLSEFWSCVRL